MTSPSCEEGSLVFSTELKIRKFSLERSGGVDMCTSSVPRQNSTFPGVNFGLLIPPLSPKGMGFLKKKKKENVKGGRRGGQSQGNVGEGWAFQVDISTGRQMRPA